MPLVSTLARTRRTVLFREKPERCLRFTWTVDSAFGNPVLTGKISGLNARLLLLQHQISASSSHVRPRLADFKCNLKENLRAGHHKRPVFGDQSELYVCWK